MVAVRGLINLGRETYERLTDYRSFACWRIEQNEDLDKQPLAIKGYENGGLFLP